VPISSDACGQWAWITINQRRRCRAESGYTLWSGVVCKSFLIRLNKSVRPGARACNTTTYCKWCACLLHVHECIAPAARSWPRYMRAKRVHVRILVSECMPTVTGGLTQRPHASLHPPPLKRQSYIYDANIRRDFAVSNYTIVVAFATRIFWV
jgi:hypothetical protein